MSDDTAKSTILGGGSIIFLGLTIQFILGFLSKVVMARYLSVENFGAITLALLLVSFIGGLSILGLKAGVSRYLPRVDSVREKRGIIISALQINIPVALVVTAVIVVFADSIAVQIGSSELAPILRIVAVIIPCVTLQAIALGSVRGYEISYPQVLTQNISLPALKMSMIVLLSVIGAGLTGFAYGFAAIYVLTAIVGVYFMLRHTPILKSEGHIPYHKTLLTYSLPLIISTLMFRILVDIDTFLLGWFYNNTSVVAIYQSSYQLANLTLVSMEAIGFLSMPVMSRLDSSGDIDGIRDTYRDVAKWAFIIALPILLMLLVFPNEMISITFGDKYKEGAFALQILALGFFTHVITGPNGDAIKALGYSGKFTTITGIIATVNIGLNLVFIPRYSYVGAATATLLSYILMNLLMSAFLYRNSRLISLPKNIVLLTFISLAIFVIFSTIIDEVLCSPVFKLLMVAVVFGIAYIPIVLFTSLDESDVLLIKETPIGWAIKPFEKYI